MRGLAQDMGMSVTPVREAIQNLISEHVLHMQSPKTIIVPRIDQAACFEVFQIRIALETLAAEQAMSHMGAADFKKLRAINARHRESLERRDIGKVLKSNNDFHFSILPQVFDASPAESDRNPVAAYRSHAELPASRLRWRADR